MIFFINLRTLHLLESRARKARNWEEADFYDSDEDTFLDRTGDIEKKREKRISRVKPSGKKTENFESLVGIMLHTSYLSFSDSIRFAAVDLSSFSQILPIYILPILPVCIFTRATLCIKRVIAVAMCLSGWLAGCLSQPVLYQNGNS